MRRPAFRQLADEKFRQFASHANFFLVLVSINRVVVTDGDSEADDFPRETLRCYRGITYHTLIEQREWKHSGKPGGFSWSGWINISAGPVEGSVD